MLTKQLHPDAVVSGGTPAPAKPIKKAYTPIADADFLTVSQKVSTSWAANPAITLLWIAQPVFKTMVDDYNAAYSTRLKDGSERPSLTQSIGQLETQMDAAVEQVKVYIQKKFKKQNAAAQYARYGILHQGSAYRFARDRDNRKTSLPLMIDAIAADGFGAEEYGTAFWTAMKTNYETAVATAGNTDGKVSTSVSSKNEQKKNITQVMNALRFVLKGNYPNTYKSIYREWGWQKEDY